MTERLWRAVEAASRRVESLAQRRRLAAARRLNRCTAHGRTACKACSRNPGTCLDDFGGCGVYADTGMHWDTCPNRVRG